MIKPQHMTPEELVKTGLDEPINSLAHCLATLAGSLLDEIESLEENAKQAEHTSDRTIANLENQIYELEIHVQRLEG